jgi:hypothetical protein
MVEDITTTLALFAICSYVLGLVTVNIYLSRTGLSDFGLLQARYVSTGALVISYIVLTMVWMVLIIWAWNSGFPLWQEVTLSVIIAPVPAALLSPLFRDMLREIRRLWAELREGEPETDAEQGESEAESEQSGPKRRLKVRAIGDIILGFELTVFLEFARRDQSENASRPVRVLMETQRYLWGLYRRGYALFGTGFLVSLGVSFLWVIARKNRYL